MRLDDPIELVTVRTAAFGTPALSIQAVSGESTSHQPPLVHRRVVFAEGELDAAVVQRSGLAHGDTLTGPAIIEEDEATTVLGPGDSGVVLATGALEVTW